jgi:transcriptional regulator with PAS, ATPase and Fis domain
MSKMCVLSCVTILQEYFFYICDTLSKALLCCMQQKGDWINCNKMYVDILSINYQAIKSKFQMLQIFFNLKRMKLICIDNIIT